MAYVSHWLSSLLQGARAGGGDPATSPLHVFGPFLRFLVAAGVAHVSFGASIGPAVITGVAVCALYRRVRLWVTDGSGGSGRNEEESGPWAVKVSVGIARIEHTLTFLPDRVPSLKARLLGLPLRTLGASILSVLVPNNSLAHSTVTNCHIPARDLSVCVEVGAHTARDLERVTCEVARDVIDKVLGGVSAFQPSVRYRAFGSSSIDFAVYLRAQECSDSILVRHEFIQALARRFASEGMVIPFPIRAINLDQGCAAQASALVDLHPAPSESHP